MRCNHCQSSGRCRFLETQFWCKARCGTACIWTPREEPARGGWGCGEGEDARKGMCRVLRLSAQRPNDLVLFLQARAQRVLRKLGDVQEIFHKRQMSLMKLAARQTRPVQPVAPHPESSPKWVSPKTSQPSVSGRLLGEESFVVLCFITVCGGLR